MSGELDDDDRTYLRLAVELSRSYRSDRRRWPFGALLVSKDKIIGRGFNRVVELSDPSAHAEIMALRAAGQALGGHEFADSVLYSSAEPCPMCLAACYWAAVSRVVFAATSRDLADSGFQDLAIYAQLARPTGLRSMREVAGEGDLRQDALAAVRDWAERRAYTGTRPSEP
jgi:tRNA(Arg) A34 adenosine deaminase TadA